MLGGTPTWFLRKILPPLNRCGSPWPNGNVMERHVCEEHPGDVVVKGWWTSLDLYLKLGERVVALETESVGFDLFFCKVV